MRWGTQPGPVLAARPPSGPAKDASVAAVASSPAPASAPAPAAGASWAARLKQQPASSKPARAGPAPAQPASTATQPAVAGQDEGPTLASLGVAPGSLLWLEEGIPPTPGRAVVQLYLWNPPQEERHAPAQPARGDDVAQWLEAPRSSAVAAVHVPAPRVADPAPSRGRRGGRGRGRGRGGAASAEAARAMHQQLLGKAAREAPRVASGIARLAAAALRARSAALGKGVSAQEWLHCSSAHRMGRAPFAGRGGPAAAPGGEAPDDGGAAEAEGNGDAAQVALAEEARLRRERARCFTHLATLEVDDGAPLAQFKRKLLRHPCMEPLRIGPEKDKLRLSPRQLRLRTVGPLQLPGRALRGEDSSLRHQGVRGTVPLVLQLLPAQEALPPGALLLWAQHRRPATAASGAGPVDGPNGWHEVGASRLENVPRWPPREVLLCAGDRPTHDDLARCLASAFSLDPAAVVLGQRREGEHAWRTVGRVADLAPAGAQSRGGKASTVRPRPAQTYSHAMETCRRPP